MEKENDAAKKRSVLAHPFVIILGVIIIFYGGYLFGKWLQVVVH